MNDVLYTVRIETNLDFGSIVEAGLELLDEHMIVVRHVDTNLALIESYHHNRAAAEDQEQRLRAHLSEWSREDPWEMCVMCLPDCDWQERWKSFFHTEHITPRLVIKPSWERYDAKNNEIVIEMDPGLSFGTGSHFTTKSCLECIDAFPNSEAQRAFLDLGCGSGILAIAAARLGFSPVVAIDVDAVAVARTRDNAETNEVNRIIECHHTSLAEYRPTGRYDLIAANLYADVLVSMVGRIGAMLAEDSHARIILSGILNEQYSYVASVFDAAGFEEVQVLSDHEWTTMMLRRRV
jgi:ribosomal protein L11 methyltransferase